MLGEVEVEVVEPVPPSDVRKVANVNRVQVQKEAHVGGAAALRSAPT